LSLAPESAKATADPLTLVNHFEGIGDGFPCSDCLSGQFTPSAPPPDPAGDVGFDHYVEIVNTAYAVFDKSGNVVQPARQESSLFQGMPGTDGAACASSGGDGLVRFDHFADQGRGRWIISVLATSGSDHYECVAVSKTSSPTGSGADAFFRYAFHYDHFNDYPKMGVWPDGYYFTYETDGPTTLKVCALDRENMLLGQPARPQICKDLSSPPRAFLPSDVDGPTLPPAGSPNYLVSFGPVQNGVKTLAFWKFHVDWEHGTSTLTGPSYIPVASYTPLQCFCIPQLDGNLLDSQGQHLMNRFAYRNFGDHESLLVSHVVDVDPGSGVRAGVRWYELRSPNSLFSPTIYQQGTYVSGSPSCTCSAWMSSLAMDGFGNLAAGFSVSSSISHPAIDFAGRLASDTPGVLRGEGSIINGAGSQSCSSSGFPNCGAWGDYTTMNVDPRDDCTFWYTNEYYTQNSFPNWHTHVGVLKSPDCP
jgi:hypothetical protein